MEGYVLFPMSKERREASCAEQEEDIGCPSESEMSATESMLYSSSGEELEDDATSSSSSSGSTDSFQMSSLMAHLPLKRGLSKFFDGKSQSFTSLAAVGTLEDLAKPLSKRLKTSRSCEVGLQDAHRRRFSHHHNAAAFKKVSKGRISVLGKAPTRLTCWGCLTQLLFFYLSVASHNSQEQEDTGVWPRTASHSRAFLFLYSLNSEYNSMQDINR